MLLMNLVFYNKASRARACGMTMRNQTKTNQTRLLSLESCHTVNFNVSVVLFLANFPRSWALTILTRWNSTVQKTQVISELANSTANLPPPATNPTLLR